MNDLKYRIGRYTFDLSSTRFTVILQNVNDKVLNDIEIDMNNKGIADKCFINMNLETPNMTWIYFEPHKEWK